MKCFVDLDGVLADFVGGAERFHGKRIDPWPPGVWDVAQVFDMSAHDFWNPLDEEFWEQLPPTKDGHFILQAVEAHFGRDNVCILTSPPVDPRSSSGKHAWIVANLTAYRRRFLIGPPKEFCAGPGKVLIDDSDEGVRKWREAGGAAVLVPRPWNARHAESLSTLRDELGNIGVEP